MIRSIVESLSGDLYNSSVESNGKSPPQSAHVPSLLNDKSAPTLSTTPTLITAKDECDQQSTSREEIFSAFKMPSHAMSNGVGTSNGHAKGKRPPKSMCNNCSHEHHESSKSSNHNHLNDKSKNSLEKSAAFLKMAREQNLEGSSGNEDTDIDISDWIFSDDEEGLENLDGLIGSNQLEFLAKFVDSFASNSDELKNLTALAAGKIKQNGHSQDGATASSKPYKDELLASETTSQQVNLKKKKKKKKKVSTSGDSLPPDLLEALNGAAPNSKDNLFDNDKALELLNLLSEKIDAVAVDVTEIEKNRGEKKSTISNKKKKEEQPIVAPQPPPSTANQPAKPNQIWISAAPSGISESSSASNNSSKKKQQKHRHISSSSSSVSSSSNQSATRCRLDSSVFKDLDEQVQAFVQNPYVAEYRFQYTMCAEEEAALITLACHHKLEVVNKREGSENYLALKKTFSEPGVSPKHACKPQSAANSGNTGTRNSAKSNDNNTAKKKKTATPKQPPPPAAAIQRPQNSSGANKCKKKKKILDDVEDSDEDSSSLDGLLSSIGKERNKVAPGQTMMLDKLEKKAMKAMEMMNKLTSCQEQYDGLLKNLSGCSLDNCPDCGGTKPREVAVDGCPVHGKLPHSAKNLSESDKKPTTSNNQENGSPHDLSNGKTNNKKKKRKNKPTKSNELLNDEEESLESLLDSFANLDAVQSNRFNGNVSDSSSNNVGAVASEKSTQNLKKNAPKCEMVDAEMQTCPEGWYICYICEQEVPQEQNLTHRAACLAEQREKFAQKTAEAERRRQRRKQRMQAKQNGYSQQSNGIIIDENSASAKCDRPCSLQDCARKGKACHFCCSVFCGPHQMLHDCPSRSEPTSLGATATTTTTTTCTGTDDLSDNEVDDVTLAKEIATMNQNLEMAAVFNSNKTSDLTYFERCQLRKNLKMKMAAMRANRRR